ncbi:MAG TPA: TlpA disulfide reductase family protein [Lentimicrobium sp.]|nr:TlpA disulfide reductase family protein [Lentimicrobium sp.]
MMFNRQLHFITFFIALTCSLNSKSQIAIDTAVDFMVKDVNSQSHHLFNYLSNDKIVVIDFFTTTCGPCQTYASHITQAYEYFGCNEGNVIFLGINWGSDNDDVRDFDSIWNAGYPSASGLQGGGNEVVELYQVLSYPTVAIIAPNHVVANSYIWPPAYDSIVQEVTSIGGMPAPCTVSAYTNLLHPESLRFIQDGTLLINTQQIYYKDLSIDLINATGRPIYHQRILPNSNLVVRPKATKGLFIAVLTGNGSVLSACKVIIN